MIYRFKTEIYTDEFLKLEENFKNRFESFTPKFKPIAQV